MRISPKHLPLSLIFLVFVLAGCSGSSSPAPNEGEETASTPLAAEQGDAGGANPFLPTSTAPPPDIPFVVQGEVSLVRDGQSARFETGHYDTDEFLGDLASWYELPGLETLGEIYVIDVYAYETEETIDPSIPATERPLIYLSFTFDEVGDDHQIAYSFPAADNLSLTVAELSFLWIEDDQIISYTLTDGEVTLHLLQATPGEPAAIEGAFSGVFTFTSLTDGSEDPTRTISVTDGVFSVADILYDELESSE